jgi:RNA polymerase sigma factor (sigma-70 family)
VRSDLRGDFGRQVKSLYHLGVVGALSDGDLLGRFLERPGEAAELAFSALVERHGSMVLHVCRSILGDDHDAQDAFQATFLVLVRRASSIRNRDSVASWLYGTALRVARFSKSESTRRRIRERSAARFRATTEARTPPDLEVSSTLLGELAKLPERYRVAVVLCYLEGRTCEQAASELGLPVGTIKSRLSRGRDRLQDRLTRLGHAPALSLILPALRSAELG